MRIEDRQTRTRAAAGPAPRAKARPWWRTGAAGVAALALVAWEIWGGQKPAAPLAISRISCAATEVRQFCRYEIEFDLNREFDNPFDPGEIDVNIEIVGPDADRMTHPAFWEVPHRCVLDHGREVVRQVGEGRWKARVSPMAAGRHRWTLTAATAGEIASASGEFICTPAERHGFVRVARADSRCLEFSDGSPFYPIGHCTRSPLDVRWQASDAESAPFADRYVADGTFAFGEWFRKMRDAGENFCSIWMTPWWCGVEWTPTRPGYEGIGRYNQKNAARLDRLVELAEEHGVFVLLFAMNHGMLSSSMDGEWRDHPYNSRHPGGFIEFATEFFESEDAQRRHRNLMRYLVARWSYSPAVAAWVLSSEIDWVEAYHGKRGGEDGKSSHDVPKRRDLVVRWLRRTANYLKAIDSHRHLVSVQVCEPYRGDDVWSVPETELVLTNAYTHTASNLSWQGEHWMGTRGVADALFVFAKKFEDRKKPVLVAEWGGTVQGNRPSQLASELHTGLWAQSVTSVAGTTGFWWWNAVDKDDLYRHFRIVARFTAREDRRGKNYDSRRAGVLMEFSPFSADEEPLYAPHPRQSALALFNDNTLRAYVFCREINDPNYSRLAAGFTDPTFPESGPCLLELPERLVEGEYRVEFWNTFTGEVFSKKRFGVAKEGRRLLPLPSHRVDLAVKMDRE